MCTYATIHTELTGSAKGPGQAWFRLTDATVYFDHPVHAMAEHTLNIDLAAPSHGPSARVALELTAASARDLVAAIQAALDSAPAGADRLTRVGRMRAVYAESINPDDPLKGLVVGERPDPEPPEGWTRVAVRAASLNHHDLWTLRGVGIKAEQLPMILGCDAAGVDESTGDEVVVHAVINTEGWTGDDTVDPGRTLLSEKHQGSLAEYVIVPKRNVRAQAGRPVLRRGGLPVDGVAHRLPDAVREVRAAAGADRARAGRVAAASPPRASRWRARPATGSTPPPAPRRSRRRRSSSARTRRSRPAPGCPSGSTR